MKEITRRFALKVVIEHAHAWNWDREEDTRDERQ
jgi:hypothetical protein